MFTKAIVFLVLGSTLILANPVRDNEKNEVANHDIQLRGIFGSFDWWLVKADKAINSVYDQVITPFKKAVQLAVETGEGVMDYTKEKVEQLTYKYYEIKSKSEENLNTLKNNFILKVIDELQRTIDVLSKQTGEESLANLKEKTQQLAESSKEALEKLQEKLQIAITDEKMKLEENLNEWKQEAEKAALGRHIS